MCAIANFRSGSRRQLVAALPEELVIYWFGNADSCVDEAPRSLSIGQRKAPAADEMASIMLINTSACLLSSPRKGVGRLHVEQSNYAHQL
jgi:hypothetical protein